MVISRAEGASWPGQRTPVLSGELEATGLVAGRRSSISGRMSPNRALIALHDHELREQLFDHGHDCIDLGRGQARAPVVSAPPNGHAPPAFCDTGRIGLKIRQFPKLTTQKIRDPGEPARRISDQVLVADDARPGRAGERRLHVTFGERPIGGDAAVRPGLVAARDDVPMRLEQDGAPLIVRLIPRCKLIRFPGRNTVSARATP